jgi:hypothetical protein
VRHPNDRLINRGVTSDGSGDLRLKLLGLPDRCVELFKYVSQLIGRQLPAGHGHIR